MRPELATLVRRRRKFLGWSQRDLAAALGSSPSRICKLEAADDSVAVSLTMRALDVMQAPLRFEIESAQDPFAGLTKEQRKQVSERLLRRKKAEQIATRAGVDAGDVEHVLFNLTLSPEQRLARSFRRAGLRRYSAK